VKLRWLVATIAYAAASVGALFAPWADSIESSNPDLRSDWALVCAMVGEGEWIAAILRCWMIPILIASMLVWLSARRGVRPAHTELSLALALGAAAYPFVSFSEPGCATLWIGSSSAAFVIIFAGVLGWKAFGRQREDLRLDESRAVIRNS